MEKSPAFFTILFVLSVSAMTWLGLFPFAAFHYLVNGKQQLQPVSLEGSVAAHMNVRFIMKKEGFLHGKRWLLVLMNGEINVRTKTN